MMSEEGEVRGATQWFTAERSLKVSSYRHGSTILDAIGSTPLIEVDGVMLKLEYLNPSGSIKARMARYIIERAEREGLLRPGDTIVEASSVVP